MFSETEIIYYLDLYASKLENKHVEERDTFLNVLSNYFSEFEMFKRY